jgi:glycerol-3-phosphate dehydrogenase (NAD(P)+)
MAFQSVGIIGAGAWGTALAVIARRAGRDVLLWAHEPETAADINRKHRNEVFLPGVSLDPAIEATEIFCCSRLRRSTCARSPASLRLI